MRIGLIPSINFNIELKNNNEQNSRTLEPYIPVGLLALAAEIEKNSPNLDINIIDLNSCQGVNRQDGETFCKILADYLVNHGDYDLYGFSSICSSYIFSVKIAQYLKINMAIKLAQFLRTFTAFSRIPTNRITSG